MFGLSKILEREPPEPKDISVRSYEPIKYGDVAGEKVSGNLPRDHFLHALRLRVELGTLSGGTDPDWTATAKEDIIKSLVLRADGTKYWKQGQWDEFKNICIQNLDPQANGSLKLYFVDPKVASRPLPTWWFTSFVLQLEFEALSNLTTGDPTAQSGTKVHILADETLHAGEDIRNWPVLVEAVRTKTVFGANTGWQRFEHERANVIASYLYHADDDGVDSDTTFDKLRLIGRKASGQFPIYNEVPIEDIKAENKQRFHNQALDTGYFVVEWPRGFNTSEFTSLLSELNIATAGTNAGLRVMERYLLGV